MSRYPSTVLATALATTMAFLGIGVIDPILPLISHDMGASRAQVELLFTAYIAIMAIAMLVAGVAATRMGGRKTLLIGLASVAACAFLCGIAQNVPELAVIRAFWGFGNALFVSTALSLIVGASTGSHEDAITLYEAALGFGIAAGPLVGGFLGGYGWRFPFFGTATFMALGWLVAYLRVREPARREPPRRAQDVFAALRHPAVLTNALVGPTRSGSSRSSRTRRSRSACRRSHWGGRSSAGACWSRSRPSCSCACCSGGCRFPSSRPA